MQDERDNGAARWTVVIPYFNEEAFLPATLACLSAQRYRPFRLVLVDNGSTDAGPACAARWAAKQLGIETILLSEETPGQVHALARGIAAADTEFLAIADADTYYPPDWLANATRLLDTAPARTIGFIGHDIRTRPYSLRARLKRRFYSHVAPLIMPHQAHGGGYAHLFRTEPFKASGGYSPGYWPYVLKDHELVHRLFKQGHVAMHPSLWVQPSDRRADRRAVRWTLIERLLYHATPPGLKDWFWYGFMARRFQARGQRDTVLRQRGWGTDKARTRAYYMQDSPGSPLSQG